MNLALRAPRALLLSLLTAALPALLSACDGGGSKPITDSGDTDTDPPGDSGDTDSGDTDSADTDSGDTDSGDTDSGEDTAVEELDHHDWSSCPGPEAYTGDTAWTGELDVTVNGVYCGVWSEDRTLDQELALKAMIKLVPGTYPLPVEDGEHPLGLAACTLLGVDRPGPVSAGAGSTTASVSAWAGTAYTTLYGEQPLDLDGEAWWMGHILLLVGDEGEPPPALVVDGSVSSDATGSGLEFSMAPEGTSSYSVEAIKFGACQNERWTEDVHHIRFDGGEIDLVLRLGDNISQTATGSFVSASGTLDGTAFSQTEYFKLIYRPGHHHFSRNFGVLFDAPIGEVCGLRFEEVDPYAESPTAIISTTDCDLTITGTRTSLDESAEIGS